MRRITSEYMKTLSFFTHFEAPESSHHQWRFRILERAGVLKHTEQAKHPIYRCVSPSHSTRLEGIEHGAIKDWIQKAEFKLGGQSEEVSFKLGPEGQEFSLRLGRSQQPWRAKKQHGRKRSGHERTCHIWGGSIFRTPFTWLGKCQVPVRKPE